MKKVNIKNIFNNIKSLLDPKKLIVKIEQDKNILVLIIIIAITILYLDLSFVLKSQLRAIKSTTPEIKSLRQDIINLNSDLIEMQTQRPKTGFTDLEVKRLASRTEVSWIIEEISRLANQQKVKIFYITPVRSLSAKKTSSGSSLDKQPFVLLDLELSGGYHQLRRFIEDLEEHSVLFEIEELDIVGNNNDPFKHKINLKIKVLFSS